jgi:hypothetical protein
MTKRYGGNRLAGIVLAIGMLGAPDGASAQERNLQTCLDGRYPSLCDKSGLTAEQRVQAGIAERRQNLKTCLDGRYPSLCRRELLTTTELRQVQQVEREANLATCITGRYPALCRKELLTPEETGRVIAAERTANLEVCLTGKYPSLCRKNLLTTEQLQKVAELERQNQRQSPPKPSSRGNTYSGRPAASVCEDGHWIEEVLADGKIIRLEDGSLWRVNDIDTVVSSIWLPVSEIVVCAGKLINTDDNESVEAGRIK